MINIVPYDPEWSRLYAEEARRIRRHFGEMAARIDHVGSTSISGLIAKPVIDIQISVASLIPAEGLRSRMQALGYTFLDQGGFSLVYPFFHRPAMLPHSHHVHICEAGGEQERRHLAFRDYLRRHPDVAHAYATLKRQLAQGFFGDSNQEQENYSLAKGSFVEPIIRQAFLEGLPDWTIDE